MLQPKLKIKSLLLILINFLLLLPFQLTAQPEGIFKHSRITSNYNEDSLNNFLSAINATKIELNPFSESKYSIRVQIDNNWLLGSEIWEYDDNLDDTGMPLEVFVGYKFHGVKKHSFEFPFEKDSHTIAEKGNKKYIINLYNCSIDTFWFEQIENIYKESNDGISNKLYYVSKVRRGLNWSFGFIHNGTFLQLTSFKHNEDSLTSSILKKFHFLEENFDIELIDLGIAIKTNKLFNQIPNAHKIVPHDDIFEVWNGNDVGFYNNDLTNNQSIEFEDLKIINLDYLSVVALKKDGFWSFYNTKNTELIFDKKAKTIEELTKLWLNR